MTCLKERKTIHCFLKQHTCANVYNILTFYRDTCHYEIWCNIPILKKTFIKYTTKLKRNQKLDIKSLGQLKQSKM